MDLVIKQEEAQALLEYLARQPYNEVFMLVEVLRGLKPVPDEEIDKD